MRKFGLTVLAAVCVGAMPLAATAGAQSAATAAPPPTRTAGLRWNVASRPNGCVLETRVIAGTVTDRLEMVGAINEKAPAAIALRLKRPPPPGKAFRAGVMVGRRPVQAITLVPRFDRGDDAHVLYLKGDLAEGLLGGEPLLIGIPGETLDVGTGDLAALMPALKTCDEERMKGLLDVPVYRLARPDRKAGSLLSLFSHEDYPDAAIKEGAQGAVKVALRVTPAGRVDRCVVTLSSNSPALDQRTCEIFQRRARFEPTLDEAGRPVAGIYSQIVRWAVF